MLTSVWTLYVGAAAGIIVMVLAAIIVGLLLKIRKSKAEFSLAYLVVLSILLTERAERAINITGEEQVNNLTLSYYEGVTLAQQSAKSSLQHIDTLASGNKFAV